MADDAGRVETNQMLSELERVMGEEYSRAIEDVEAKIYDYWRRFESKDATWQRWVREGRKTQAEYDQWRTGQLIVGERWENLRDGLAQDYHHTNVNARRIADGVVPNIYIAGHDYATYTVERTGIDTNYLLYDRETVSRLLTENPRLLPSAGVVAPSNIENPIAARRDVRWNLTRLQSCALQGILQGESIPNLARRVARETGEMNHRAAIRNARTMCTNAENAGRYNGFRRAAAMGIDLTIMWRATLDMRTRHSHRQLDGQTKPVDEPFEVNGVEIRYPADLGEGEYKVPPEMIWGCRCTLIGKVSGWVSMVDNDRDDSKISNVEWVDESGRQRRGMTYEEWKNSHDERPLPITHQEDVGNRIREQYISEYRRR